MRKPLKDPGGCIDTFLHLVVGLVFFPIGIVFSYQTVDQYFNKKNTLKYGIKTTGIVAKTYHELENNQHWYSYDIHYVVSNGDTLIKAINDLHKVRYQKGQQLEMRYLIDMPYNALIVQDDDSFSIAYFFPLGVLFAGFWCLYKPISQYYVNRKERKKEK